MDHAALTITGTLGWVLLIVWSGVRECQAGRALTALVGMLVLSVLTIEFWALGPSELGSHWPKHWLVGLGWPVAVTPYVLVVLRVRHLWSTRVIQEMPAKEPQMDADERR